MALTTEQKEMVIARLAERGVKSECQLCGKNDWIVARDLVSLNYAGLDEMIYVGRAIPAVVLICTNCGNILLISAGALGLLEELKKKKKEEFHE